MHDKAALQARVNEAEGKFICGGLFKLFVKFLP